MFRVRVRAPEARHTQPTAGCRARQSVQPSTVGGADSGVDNGKQGQGRKRPVLVEPLGVFLLVVVPAASLAEPAGARTSCQPRRGTGTTRRTGGVEGTSRGAAELLRQVPGIHIDQAGACGGISSVYVRGSNPNFTVLRLMESKSMILPRAVGALLISQC